MDYRDKFFTLGFRKTIVNYFHNLFVNQFTSEYFFFFRSPRTGLFSVNINIFSLSMKRSPNNKINASFIDISRIKWLVFFYCGRLSSVQLHCRPLASSEATTYYRPPLGRTDRIPEIHQRQWIWIRLYKFLAGRNRLWIKGLGKNPQKSVKLIHWQQSGATKPCPLGLRETRLKLIIFNNAIEVCRCRLQQHHQRRC